MRSPVAMVIAATALASAQSAGAAPPPAPPPAVQTAPAAKPAEGAPESPKHAACERTWRAQTKHTGKHKAFIASCVAKG